MEEKYAYIEFRKGFKREISLPHGNTRTIDESSFYVKRGQETKQRHFATFLAPELAAQIAAFYPEKTPEIHEEIRHTNDSTAPLAKELFEVGEAASAEELESVVRRALRVLKTTEVQAVVKKVLQEPA